MHVNEDNNDELFSDAAGDYFLKADNPDWEQLSDKINPGNPGAAGETTAKKNRYHQLLSLLLGFSHALLYRGWFVIWPFKTKKKNKRGLLSKNANHACFFVSLCLLLGLRPALARHTLLSIV